MRKQISIASLLTIAAIAAGSTRVANAQGQDGGPAQPAKVKSSIGTMTMDSDGAITRTRHTEFQILNSAGVLSLSQVPISYSSQMVDIDITGAYTLKTSGEKIPVNASAIFSRQQPATAGAPLFNDLMQKVVIFPDVEVGDTLVFDQTERQKQTLFDGQYMDQRLFSTIIAEENVTYTVTVPSSKFLNVDATGVTMEKKRDGDRTIYIFKHSNPKAIADTNPQLSTWDRMPRFFVSTFRSYDEMGHAYAAMVAPKMAVSPNIQALADRLTAGVTDRREQARKIYDYVSSKIRYVAIALGTGAIVPHDAESVLNNGYGDCKDKVMLLSALLKAKGIASEPVLINGTNAYTLSGPPTLAQLNHLIIWLPEFKMYADATAQVAPFGILPLQEYGKPVVHAVATGPVRHVIPVVAPNALSISERTAVTLDDSGKFTGTTQIDAIGPFDISLRSAALFIQANGAQRAASPAIHPSFRFNAPEQIESKFNISGNFSVDANPRLLTGDGFVPPPGTWIVTRPGGVLMGAVTQNTMTETDDTPCYSGHEDETITLSFPDNRHITALPPDTEIKSDHLHYTAYWSVSGHTLIVRRAFDTAIDQPICKGAVRKEAMAALTRIRQDYATQVALAPN